MPTTFTLTEREFGDVIIVDIKGCVDNHGGAGMLREKTRDLIQQKRKKIILNLSENTYFDSTGIGELVYGWQSVYNNEGRLVLLKPPKRLKDLLRITKLYTIFEVFSDEDAAIRSFN